VAFLRRTPTLPEASCAMRQAGRLLCGVMRSANAVAGLSQRGMQWSCPPGAQRCAAPFAANSQQQSRRGSTSTSSSRGGGEQQQQSTASVRAATRLAAGAAAALVASSVAAAESGRAGGASQTVDELPHRVDHYNGVIIDAATLPATEAEFLRHLHSSLASWKAAGRRGVWLQVPLAHASYVGPAVQAGFIFHHAEPGHVRLTTWLPGGPSPLPANASHQVGVGAFVLNSAGHVLVVQERTGPAARPGFWKLPTGIANQGEDIADAAVREVLEETGVRTRFSGIVGFRQAHGMAFDKSDLFFLCALTLEDPNQMALTPQESEIADAKWMSMVDFTDMPHVKDERTVWGHLNALCCAWARGAYAGIQAIELPVGFRPGTNTVFRAALDEAGMFLKQSKL